MMRERWPSSVVSTSDDKWPCQRLRMGFSLILFFVFEILIGKRLPLPIPLLALALGMVIYGSAMLSIRQWKLAVQLALVKDALTRVR